MPVLENQHTQQSALAILRMLQGTADVIREQLPSLWDDPEEPAADPRPVYDLSNLPDVESPRPAEPERRAELPVCLQRALVNRRTRGSRPIHPETGVEEARPARRRAGASGHRRRGQPPLPIRL